MLYRWHDVMTSHRRWYDIVLWLCACWVCGDLYILSLEILKAWWRYRLESCSWRGGYIVYQGLCLFVFVALCPMSTAMVIAGRSVHLTTLFPGQAWVSGLPVICAHTFACNWQQPFLNKSAEGRRMTVEIISWSISTKVWYRAGIKLATPGSAVRHASVARHVTDCPTLPGVYQGLYRQWGRGKEW